MTRHIVKGNKGCIESLCSSEKNWHINNGYKILDIHKRYCTLKTDFEN